MQIEIRFPTESHPGGQAVDAHFEAGGIQHTVHTDQPEKSGGDGTAPSPFDLFLASIATCAGYYALRFCQQRNLPTDGLRLHLTLQRHPETRRLTNIDLTLTPPTDFPDKYHQAILRAMDQCTVKKTIADPPEITSHLAGSAEGETRGSAT